MWSLTAGRRGASVAVAARHARPVTGSGPRSRFGPVSEQPRHPPREPGPMPRPQDGPGGKPNRIPAAGTGRRLSQALARRRLVCEDSLTHVGPGHAMAQAIVDPAEIRRFAHNLKVFTGDVRGDLSSLHTQLLALGDTWRDQEHDRFIQEFEQTVAVLEKFLEVAESTSRSSSGRPSGSKSIDPEITHEPPARTSRRSTPSRTGTTPCASTARRRWTR